MQRRRYDYLIIAIAPLIMVMVGGFVLANGGYPHSNNLARLADICLGWLLLAGLFSFLFYWVRRIFRFGRNLGGIWLSLRNIGLLLLSICIPILVIAIVTSPVETIMANSAFDAEIKREALRAARNAILFVCVYGCAIGLFTLFFSLFGLSQKKQSTLIAQCTSPPSSRDS